MANSITNLRPFKNKNTQKKKKKIIEEKREEDRFGGGWWGLHAPSLGIKNSNKS